MIKLSAAVGFSACHRLWRLDGKKFHTISQSLLRRTTATPHFRFQVRKRTHAEGVVRCFFGDHQVEVEVSPRPGDDVSTLRHPCRAHTMFGQEARRPLPSVVWFSHLHRQRFFLHLVGSVLSVVGLGFTIGSDRRLCGHPALSALASGIGVDAAYKNDQIKSHRGSFSALAQVSHDTLADSTQLQRA